METSLCSSSKTCPLQVCWQTVSCILFYLGGMAYESVFGSYSWYIFFPSVLVVVNKGFFYMARGVRRVVLW